MTTSISKTDVVLIGGGIMSATLGTLLKELKPDWNIKVFEKLDDVAIESSNAWNNAGTGHSALCELNYTPELSDGSIEISKAIKINEQFQISKQLWAYLIEKGYLDSPEDFIRTVPHMSFVEGEKNVEFLKKRVEKLTESPLFEGMEYSDDYNVLKEWLPLMMEGRKPDEEIGVTRIDSGTDINFGSLTKKLFKRLEEQGVEMNFKHAVQDIRRTQKDKWQVKVKNLNNSKMEYHTADFVFIGAGGGSLPLLQKTNIPESKNIGGFPVSGLFLVCDDEEVVNQHEAKVYGKAKVGAPPMSVPHLDTRYIDGKRSLLFGPFAGFSPKFLKTGSYLDLFGSVKPNNVLTMLSAGAKELGLTKYLVQQVLLKEEQRMDELREFIPEARSEDWKTITAGQRVQMIKDTDKGKGTLMFGTETIVSEDGSMAALLGASPGASVCVDAMLELLSRAFPEDFGLWQDKIKEMIPTYGISLSDNPDLFKEMNERTTDTLGLKSHEAGALLS
ncbi:malate dehydrogenase (quinone) [Jeotgalicoccus nanhaiensis]|jgi:malate:quinone-oxidoreductase|uniref:Probable malate:quinone oxidoreductase n=1 Tax=Jeotgalicoccus nanhaiensis TaxID=568603 RepID=A0ABR9XYS7_9STAP|nr:malate dehydrogenase (quinone) [Jeotgalicoccus nanhaiensis]MBF0753900.1 malate dehydrogenase (quinone) [Jeotgalicoccus nanhaiensis]TFU62056.1 malate dehydrogenase (quinone) [Jeotgalicoccus nanhaiensis]